MTLPERYNPKEAEKRWQEQWLKDGVYEWKQESRGQESESALSGVQSSSQQARRGTSNNYVIDTPPPTVSGLLHMGHIFSYTQADFVARYQRMMGKNVFYPMGFDDNGLPTERLVEKVEKKRAVDMSREDFIKLCEKVVVEAEEEFRTLFKSIALSVDWKQEYQTISPESRKISQMSFLDLYKKQEAYRKKEPFYWDPVDQTAIATAEIEEKELQSHWNDIHFGLDGSDAKITIGTTRPELIPACVAVFYHPDDARYQHLKGKFAITPLFGVKVPLLADEAVKMDKGTGLVMCCTFGDDTDKMWWRSHKLPMRVVLDKFGRLRLKDKDWLPQNAATEALEGLKTSNTDPKHFGARQKIIELIREAGLLVDQKPITHAVKCAERSGAPIEIMDTWQWYIKVCDKKDALLDKARQCVWRPEFMRLRIEQWIEGLNQDWCISRQRYFGVPFPVWYETKWSPKEKVPSDIYSADGIKKGTMYGTRSESLGSVIEKGELGEIIPTGKPILAHPDDLPVNPLKDLPRGYKGRKSGLHQSYDARDILTENIIEAIHEETGEEVLLTPDMDVMDTWATSSVSPQLSSKAINKDFAVDFERHQQLFPADLRPQAHEIIRTWAFYTIVKAHLHEDTIPWKNLMISGWCLASDKTKMSKSKGNVITPTSLIEEKGSDAVRYWASTSRLGSDTAFSEDVLKIGNKLVNKLWNSAKFGLQASGFRLQQPTEARSLTPEALLPLDRWIITRLAKAIEKATAEFDEYEYCAAREAIEDFFWKDFCDNYLEMIKVRAYGEGAAATSAHQTTALCLEAILRLFAPFVPHITEELYQHLFAPKNSIHARGMWPKADAYFVDAVAEKSGIAAVEVLDAVRAIKAEKKVSIKYPIVELVLNDALQATLEPVLFDLKSVTNAENIRFAKGDAVIVACTLAEKSDAA